MDLYEEIKENLEIITESKALVLPDASSIIQSQGTFHIKFNIDNYAKYVRIGDQDTQYNIISASTRSVAEKRYNQSKPSIVYAIINHAKVIAEIYKEYDANFIPGEDIKSYPILSKSIFLQSIIIDGFTITNNGIEVKYLFDSKTYDQVHVQLDIRNKTHKIEHILLGIL